MTRWQSVGVMLIALGIVYALLYAAWVRKRRRHASAAVAVERHRTEDGAPAAPVLHDERSATIVAEGTYISTTTAASRLERVAVEGLGNRSRATLTISRGSADSLVRIDRQGESTVVIPAARLLSAGRERGMAGKFLGSARILVLQWRTDAGDIYETGFLPRYRADVDRVESALWWHSGEDPNRGPDESGTEDSGSTQTEGETTP